MTPNDHHDDQFVRDLFDKMGPTYDRINVISSFGFSEWWRRQCVQNGDIVKGSHVCDMMAGSGECWPYLLKKEARITSVDFSDFMVERQTDRNHQHNNEIDIKCENAVDTSIPDQSIDTVVSAFGLKTLSTEALQGFAKELHRILKPGGTFSLIEISVPTQWWIKTPYLFYLRFIIPLIGKFCLGDIECYRMLGTYTREFQSCARVIHIFQQAGLEVQLKNHFFGCATSLMGSRFK